MVVQLQHNSSQSSILYASPQCIGTHFTSYLTYIFSLCMYSYVCMRKVDVVLYKMSRIFLGGGIGENKREGKRERTRNMDIYEKNVSGSGKFKIKIPEAEYL